MTITDCGLTGEDAPSAAVPQQVLVLGGGIAGMTAALKLAEAGYKVTLVERSQRLGGTHRSREIGAYTFDVGSIFYEDRAQLFDLAEGLRDLCPPVRRIQRRIAPEGQVVHYPIEPRDLMRWSTSQKLRALVSLVWFRLAGQRDGTLLAVCNKYLGSVFFQGTGLRNYIERFNHTASSSIDEMFFFKRMGFVAQFTKPRMLLRAVSRALLRKSVQRTSPTPLRVRPVTGFDSLFQIIRKRLEARGVDCVFEADLQRLTKDGMGYEVVTSAGAFRAATVVSALPLEVLHQAMFATPSGLPSLNLLTLFVSAQDLDEATGTVLFNFHKKGRWKRLTVYSRIYPERFEGRHFFSVEVTFRDPAGSDPEAAFADFSTHFQDLNLASGLRLEGHEIIEGAYPFYAHGFEEKRKEILARVAQSGIVLVGRQGRYEYLPTASGMIKRVNEVLAESGILHHIPTDTSAPN